MLGKTAAVLALTASCVITGVGPVVAAGKASQAASENSPWYQTDYGAALSRANNSEHVLTPASVPNVGYLRSVVAPPVPPFVCSNRLVAPALVGGDLYAITGAELSKYNAATGQLIWHSTPDPTLDTFYESLSVAGNEVVVGGTSCSSVSEPPSAFFAYNAATGQLLWSVDPSEGLSQAVVSNGYVVTAGTDAAGYFFYVLNLSTGATVWSSTSSCIPKASSPLVVGSLAMSYGCDSQGNATIEARNLGTGALVWTQSGTWTFQRGNSGDNQLFATDPAGAVVAVNPLTGQQEYTLSQAVTVLAVDNSRAYASCASRIGGRVCAYNVSTGALEWQSQRFGAKPALAAEAGGVLYLDVGYALNAATGHAIKQLPINPFAVTALAVGDGRIAAVSDPRVLDLFGLPGY